MTQKKLPRIDQSIKAKGSNLTAANYNFVFSDNIDDWTGTTRSRTHKERVHKKLNEAAQVRKKAYHRSMPSIGSQL